MWVYYQRLTDQTLYTIVNRYVEPKIAEVERAIAGIENDMADSFGAPGNPIAGSLARSTGLPRVSCMTSGKNSCVWRGCLINPTSTTA